MTLVVFAIFTFVRRKKIPLWFYIGILFLIIGFIVLYISPGSSARGSFIKSETLDGILRYMNAKEFFSLTTPEMIVRANVAYGHFFKSIVFVSVFLSFLPVVVKFFKRGIKLYVAILVLLVLSYLTRFFLDVYSVGVILILLLICALILRAKLRTLYTKLFFLQLAWAFLGGLTVLYIDIPHRAHMADHIVSLISILLIFGYFYKDFDVKFNLKRILNYVLPIGTLIYALYVLFAYYNYYTLQQAAFKEIQSQKARGIEDIVIDPKYYKASRFYDRLGEWGSPSANASEWPNFDIAKYYGVKSFRLGTEPSLQSTMSVDKAKESTKVKEPSTETSTLESSMPVNNKSANNASQDSTSATQPEATKTMTDKTQVDSEIKPMVSPANSATLTTPESTPSATSQTPASEPASQTPASEVPASKPANQIPVSQTPASEVPEGISIPGVNSTPKDSTVTNPSDTSPKEDAK
ncbi:hypothetical protein BKH40_01220 [Helicobacter sp. 11S02629-2]|nr:hypothetical protein BKH40_01220 [Helicobacter sp. 11S02629-2]